MDPKDQNRRPDDQKSEKDKDKDTNKEGSLDRPQKGGPNPPLPGDRTDQSANV